LRRVDSRPEELEELAARARLRVDAEHLQVALVWRYRPGDDRGVGVVLRGALSEGVVAGPAGLVVLCQHTRTQRGAGSVGGAVDTRTAAVDLQVGVRVDLEVAP